ncbi:tRNA glutamyl-Q(34) synthetase GluQRS [Glaciecola sp. 2405UD65-10]|uniref:tRNA glutamyl-Q(34) synthetase GluQRS n=1 Tax=Glaciecola sp. 2405UD65-10 TaxID=3397244 RepID=UPI003B5B3239
MNTSEKSMYVGRFAPSPSGPLHFGSLVCALASYLHAKQHNGKWLLRIEDIDTPRINPAMNEVILRSLELHGLKWDNEVSYQSQRHHLYEHTLSELEKRKLIYACSCSRKQIRARSGTYDGHCRLRNLPSAGHAIRFMHSNKHTHFQDLYKGEVHIKHAIASEDPVLKRADGIYAYHLAVVADDIEQGVTHIVRGNDLIDTTPIHLGLYAALKQNAPQYLHIPVLVQKQGEKLSKQHHSPAIDDQTPLANLKLALYFLGLQTPAYNAEIEQLTSVESLLAWATVNWQSKMLSKQSEILISVTNGVYSVPLSHKEVQL